MPRKPRYLQRANDAAYHVLNRGHNREALFAHDDDKAAFLKLLRRLLQPADALRVSWQRPFCPSRARSAAE